MQHGFWAVFWSEVGILLGHWPFLVMLLVVWLGMAGTLARGAGFHRFFRDDRATLERAGTRWIWVSAAFWSQFGLASLAGVAWIGMHSNRLWVCGPDGGRASCAFYPWEGATGPALLGLVGASAAAAAIGLLASRHELRRPLANRADDRRDLEHLPAAERRAELLRGAAGAVLGTATTLAAAGLALAARTGLVAFLAFTLIGAVALLVVNRNRKFLACLSVIGFFIGLVLGLSVASAALSALAGMRDGWGLALALAAFGVAVAANGGAFKYRIPGFPDTAYAPRRLVDPDVPGDLPGHPGPIDPIAALEAWHRRAAPKAPDGKPVLVLLATSGGAYRASFWTALLLDKLVRHDAPGDDFEGLAANLRLVTGASGGMVAGAYFTVMRAFRPVEEDGRPVVKGSFFARRAAADAAREPTVCERIAGDIERHQKSAEGGRRNVPVPRDSLTAVLQQTLRHDVPRILWPGKKRVDRGTVLDDQWETLKVTFAALRASEAAGVAPSIVLTPMLVESGAPAFFTNLDLAAIRVDGERRPDGAHEPNRDSVEIFDAFPAAWLHDEAGDGLRLGTAPPEAVEAAIEAGRGITLATTVRLNATFPYISPAISLPTGPGRRRLVDAGYYDNYGVDVATLFLNARPVRQWIVENCGGVAILQARAFPSDPPRPPAGRLARAMQFLTSPPEALFKARASSQLFRNDEQIQLVQRSYEEHFARVHGRAADGFLESFVFEAPVEASMSWALTEDEIEAMKSILKKAGVGEAPRAAGPEGLSQSEREADYASRKQRELTRTYLRLKAFWAARAAPPTPELSARAPETAPPAA